MIYAAHHSSKAKPLHTTRVRSEDHFNPHQQYWLTTAGYTLSALLSNAGYSHQSKVSYLHHFANFITPYMGASPESELRHWKSFMTDDHTPIELSWDFHTGVEKPTIRYSIEPISLDAGTLSNPHNQRAGSEFKRLVTRVLPNTDTLLFDHFESCFSQTWTNDVPEGHRSTVFWAFDLKENAVTTKGYFFPGTVAHGTNRTNLAVISDAIRSAPGCSPDTLVPFNLFSDYVGQTPDLKLEIDMLALDLVPVEKSRLKIYFRNRRTNFGSVRETMSLGGRIQGPEFDAGMEKLKRLWNALMGIEGVPENVSLPHKDHRTAGILYNIEYRAGDMAPKVKLYIPARHYAKNDGQVLSALKGFLTEETGQQQELPTAPTSIERYSKCLHDIVDRETLENDLGLHTYIGCSVQSGGKLRVVAYMNPQKRKLKNQGQLTNHDIEVAQSLKHWHHDVFH